MKFPLHFQISKMFTPPALVYTALKPYYPETTSKPVFIYSTIAYKLTRFKKWIPYMIFATKQHMVLLSFMRERQKDPKKQLEAVKIFLRQQIKLFDDGNLTLRIEIMNNSVPVILRLNSQQELSNWIMLANSGLTPVMHLNVPLVQKLTSAVKSVFDYETIQIEFLNSYKKAKYFSIYPFIQYVKSKQQIAKQAVQKLHNKLNNMKQEDELEITIDLKSEMNIGIYLSQLLGICGYSQDFELDSGSMKQTEQIQRDQQGAIVRKYFNYEPVPGPAMYPPEVDDWTTRYYQLHQRVIERQKEMESKNVTPQQIGDYIEYVHNKFFKPIDQIQFDEDDLFNEKPEDQEMQPEGEEPQDPQEKSKKNKKSANVSLTEDDVDAQAFVTYQKQLNDNLYQKLRQNVKQDEIQSSLTQPTQEDSLCYDVSQFVNLLALFRRQCEVTVQQLVQEFSEPYHMKSLQDQSTLDKYQHYYPEQYAKEWQQFEQLMHRVDQNALENMMSVLGPVHGSIYAQGVGDYSHIVQNINCGMKIGEKMPSSGFGYQQSDMTNGFENGFFEHLKSDRVNVMHYPNQPPPVFETVQNAINFKFVTLREAHQKINTRRDTEELLLEDELALKQVEWELQVINALSAQKELKTQVSALVQYYGFYVFCQAKDYAEVSSGFSKEENTVQYVLPAENLRNKLESVGKVLNIEPHLVNVQIGAKNAVQEYVLGKQYDTQAVIDILVQGLEKDKLYLISQFVSTYQGDLIDQLQYVTFGKAYSVSEMQNKQVLVTTPLSGLISTNGDIIKNLASLLIPDTPQKYIDLLRESSDEDRQLLNDQYGSCRLPVKFTQIIDEKINPDVAINAFMSDETEMAKVQQEMIVHITSLSQNHNQLLDTQLFLKYLLGKIQRIMNQKALETSVRQSDYYRTQYLPIVQSYVDQYFQNGKLTLDQISLTYEYLQIPTYLWLYTSNFSKYTEIYQTIRLDVTAIACTRKLNESLRKLRRSAQQFGMPVMSLFDDQTQNEIDELVKNERFDLSQLQNMNMQRLNWFTGSSDNRQVMLEDGLKLVACQFLNNLLGLQNNNEFFRELDAFIQTNYCQHAFATEYSEMVIENQYNQQNRNIEFKWEKISRVSLFGEDMQTQIEQLKATNYFEKPHSTRTYLLNKICEKTGILLSDTMKYDYSCEKVFFVKDILQFQPIITTPQIAVLQQFQVPYNNMTSILLEMEHKVNSSFSSGSFNKAEQKEADLLKSAKESLFVQRETDTSQLLTQLRAVHFNFVYFNCIAQNKNFVDLFMDLALNLSKISGQLHANLTKTKNPQLEQIYNYLEQLETQKLLSSTALALVRRNSPQGAIVYQKINTILQNQQQFLKDLEKGSKAAFVILNKELMQESNILIKEKKLPNDEQAQALSLKSVCNVYSKYSLEAVKIRINHALQLMNRDCIKQAVEQLLICESLVTESSGKTARILGEVYNTIALCYFKQQKFIQSLQYFEKAVEVFWRDASEDQAQTERLEQILESFQQRILQLQGEKTRTYKRGLIKLTTPPQNAPDSVPIAPESQQLNAKVLLDAKLGLKLGRLVNETTRQMQNPDRARVILVQSVRSVEQKLKIRREQLEQTNLIISQIHFNMAEVLQNTRNTNNEIQSKQLKDLAVQALQTRARILGRTHLYTLQSLYQVAQIDFVTGNIEAAVISTEFLMQNLIQIDNDLKAKLLQTSLNPINIGSEMSSFACFRLLVNCALQSLSLADQKILSFVQQQIKMSTVVDVNLANDTLKEIMESQSVVGAVQDLFRLVRDERSQQAGQKIFNLLKMLETDYVQVFDSIQEELGASMQLDFVSLAKKGQTMKKQMGWFD
ncbi:Conserved_hypothetical protein [Hexamita inflata]|uniref:Clu domain-containing protein n=1 Tax=Hexamita inflata TaxID=28002 RepID=A0AA86V5D5_9EUKA|nr:Conserved hypothetical protein [Hexamita inflata]